MGTEHHRWGLELGSAVSQIGDVLTLAGEVGSGGIDLCTQACTRSQGDLGPTATFRVSGL